MQREVVRAREAPGKREDLLRQPVHVVEMHAVDADPIEERRRAVPVFLGAEPDREILAAPKPAKRREAIEVRREEEDFGVVLDGAGEAFDVAPDSAAMGVRHEKHARARRRVQALEGARVPHAPPLVLRRSHRPPRATALATRHTPEAWMRCSCASRSNASFSA